MTTPVFKRLSLTNWLKPDPMLNLFVRLSPQDGSMFRPTANQRAEEFLRPQLSEYVPPDVRHLFEVARGALLYEVFFYPLYVLGSEQLLRVAEAAVAHKCVVIKAPSHVRRGKFQKQLAYLRQEELIPESAWVRWDATRNLRNVVSHPEKQTLYGPSEAVRELWITAEQINALFPEPQPGGSGAS